MMRFDRFTERAQQAAQQALALASQYGHSQVDVEHLFMSLLKQEAGTVPEVLSRLGVDLTELTSKVDKLLRESSRPGIYGSRGGQQVFITPRVKRVLDLAREEATKFKDEYISTEHLLLAMLHDRGTPLAKIFQAEKKLRMRVSWKRCAISAAENGLPLPKLNLLVSRCWKNIVVI